MCGNCDALDGKVIVFALPYAEEELLHTPEHPYCDREGCPCHIDEQVEQGLLTEGERERTLIGAML
jgi:hypothetical protein